MRYKTGRTMMHLDEEYFHHLKGFKSGFSGNELRVIKDVLGREFEGSQESRRILDVGSGDGVWLGKMIRFFSDLDIDIQYTAIEPVENDELERVASKYRVEVRHDFLEDYSTAHKEFDAVLSTQSAYYYFNEGWAHSNICGMLKDKGIYVVTLASDACILHEITEFLVGGALQKVFTAESYIRHVAKLGIFEIDAVHRLEGRFDWEHYVNDDASLKSLAYVLSRHRLPREQLDERINALRDFVKSNCCGRSRINRVVVLRKRFNAILGGAHYSPGKKSKRVFISHSSKQKAHADNLHYMLTQAGFLPTLDSFDIKAGQELSGRIEVLINECDYFVLLLSKDSIASPWVQTEVSLACSKGMLDDERLLPVQVEPIDDATANSIPLIPKNTYSWLDGTKGMRVVIDRLQEASSRKA